MRGLPVLIVLAAGLCYSVACLGEPLQSREGLAAALGSPDAGTRVRARTTILRERISLVQGLIDTVRCGTDANALTGMEILYGGSKHLAILLLGDLRAPEAIPVLAVSIMCRVRPLYGSYGATSTIVAQYPAADSLAKIGTPAVPTILARLGRCTDPLERQICVWILTQIEGSDLAKFLVSKAIRECDVSFVKANLQAALEYFDKEDLDFAPPEEPANTDSAPRE